MLEYKLSVGEAPLKVELEARQVGEDWQVLLTAGAAHVGAVALAVPCPRTKEGVTASVSTMTVPGHRDDLPAGRAALAICKATARPVTVTAGLHLDHATLEEIKALVDNSQAVVNKLIKILEEE